MKRPVHELPNWATHAVACWSHPLLWNCASDEEERFCRVSLSAPLHSLLRWHATLTHHIWKRTGSVSRWYLFLSTVRVGEGRERSCMGVPILDLTWGPHWSHWSLYINIPFLLISLLSAMKDISPINFLIMISQYPTVPFTQIHWLVRRHFLQVWSYTVAWFVWISQLTAHS